MIYHFQNYIPF